MAAAADRVRGRWAARAVRSAPLRRRVLAGRVPPRAARDHALAEVSLPRAHDGRWRRGRVARRLGAREPSLVLLVELDARRTTVPDGGGGPARVRRRLERGGSLHAGRPESRGPARRLCRAVARDALPA